MFINFFQSIYCTKTTFTTICYDQGQWSAIVASSNIFFSSSLNIECVNQSQYLIWSVMILKVTPCAFHNDELITNFCRAPECLLPMCPKCIKVHSEEHTEANTKPIFETYLWYNIASLQSLRKSRNGISTLKSCTKGLMKSCWKYNRIRRKMSNWWEESL
jgi:hypothetical protein